MSHTHLFNGAQMGKLYEISDALRDERACAPMGHLLKDILNEAQTAAAKAPPEPAHEGGWMSVKDSLPELLPVVGAPDWRKSRKVLVFTDRQVVAFLHQVDGCAPEWFTDCSETWRIKPTHYKNLGADPT